jgi:hypothetical protein
MVEATAMVDPEKRCISCVLACAPHRAAARRPAHQQPVCRPTEPRSPVAPQEGPVQWCGTRWGARGGRRAPVCRRRPCGSASGLRRRARRDGFCPRRDAFCARRDVIRARRDVIRASRHSCRAARRLYRAFRLQFALLREGACADRRRLPRGPSRAAKLSAGSPSRPATAFRASPAQACSVPSRATLPAGRGAQSFGLALVARAQRHRHAPLRQSPTLHSARRLHVGMR